jgi:hypothetical protein
MNAKRWIALSLILAISFITICAEGRGCWGQQLSERVDTVSGSSGGGGGGGGGGSGGVVIAAPSNLVMTVEVNAQQNTRRIVLSWADNSNNETGFIIEWKNGVDGVYSGVGGVGANVSTIASQWSTIEVSFPPGSPNNYYRVRAYILDPLTNAFTYSGYSNEVIVDPNLPVIEPVLGNV